MPLEEYIGASLYPQKLAASLLGALGSLAVILAAVGLYSVLAYAVMQRTHEIAIRMALGARPADVLRLVVRQGLTVASLGLAMGLALALAVSRVFQRPRLWARRWVVTRNCLVSARPIP